MEDAIVLQYHISADDFTRAGEASSDVKGKLKQLGINPAMVRKVAIAMYEGEINMVIHAKGGEITVEITPQKVRMVLDDVGPGIPDIEQVLVKFGNKDGNGTVTDKGTATNDGTVQVYTLEEGQKNVTPSLNGVKVTAATGYEFKDKWTKNDYDDADEIGRAHV